MKYLLVINVYFSTDRYIGKLLIPAYYLFITGCDNITNNKSFDIYFILYLVNERGTVRFIQMAELNNPFLYF